MYCKMNLKAIQRRVIACVVGSLSVSVLLWSRNVSENEQREVVTYYNRSRLLHEANNGDTNGVVASSNTEIKLRRESKIAPGGKFIAGTPFDLALCNESQKLFGGTFDQNLKKLKLLSFPAARKWIDKLGLNKKRSRDMPSFPVLVTGASRRYFEISQGVIKSVHEKLLPKYQDLTFIYYDLGLAKDQREKLERYCKCEVRDFPAPEDLPPHARNWNVYAFKPIIISILFQEFGHVWWVDSSVRFTTDKLDGPLQYLRQTGSLFFTYGEVLSVAKHTVITTFNYFQEDPCPYNEFGEIEAGNVAFFDNPASRVIIRKWVSCALIRDCIAPPGNHLSCRHVSTIVGKCHRYDQSVLSIILRRLYHEQNDYPLVEKPFRIIKVMRGQKVPYLAYLENQEKEIPQFHNVSRKNGEELNKQ